MLSQQYVHVLYGICMVVKGLTSPSGSVVKNLPASAGDPGDVGSLPGSRRSPGEGNGNPLQSFCLGNPMNKRTLEGCNPWGCTESDTTEHAHT